MKNFKMPHSWILKKLFYKSFFIYIFAIIFLTSCIQAPNNKRLATAASSTTSTTTTSSNLPTFKDAYNYFQNGGTTYTSTFTLTIDFADTFYFRGKDVDTYIRNVNTSTPICLVTRYNATGVKKVAIMAMMPRSTYNYTNQSLEYYYSVSPSDDTTNQNYCLKTSLVNKLNSSYSDLTQIYKLKSLCTSGVCLSTGYSSEQIQLFSASGVELTSMATTGLLLSIKNATTTTTTTNSTCVANSECVTQGYDCCLSNQCVKDLQAKTLDSTTLASIEYKQALQDILNYPSKIYNYPQYYNICSTSSSTTTTTTTSTASNTDLNNAQIRLNKLAYYYSCVNKVVGESGECVKTYPGITAAGTYSLPVDDRSFVTTFTNNLVSSNALSAVEKIYYGNVLLFDYASKTDADLSQSTITDNTYYQIVGNTNDDLITGTQIKLLPALFTSAFSGTSTDLVVVYKNDASCTYINSTTSKCEKYYTQGQKSDVNSKAKRVTDHYPASNIFYLPSYANTTKTIKVELDGVALIQGTDWDVITGSPSYIQLYPTSSSTLRAQDEQVVKITYFSTLAPMVSKIEALEGIKTTCSCSDYTCNLAPVKNSSGSVVDYSCVYPPNNIVTVPVSQKVYLSSKSVPMRYYDSSSQPVDALTSTTTIQEGAESDATKSMLAFKYTNNDLSKPNNLTSYVGFYEIYGSINSTTNSAKPPQVVSLTKGSSYDIYVDNGSYYSCAQCGADYYSQINKLFPSLNGAGGLIPMQTQSNRIATLSTMTRSDDFAFGRACFVPATMIPWSHAISSDVATQRKNRLQTQHFLFANGYQRDWYGFDYGAVIGSFDGIKWFAIGTNRRIKATSNKLFIAVNAPMGDLAIESTYTVSINDATLNPAGTGMIQTDIDNDGAQCQKYHQCSIDKDCYATLGPDYVCGAVTEITSSWPVFDDNANEQPDANVSNKQLTAILGLSNPGKRCVYRGRGSLCSQNYNTVNINSTFNATTNYDFHACSSNSYCQTFSDSSGYVSAFNNRVNRYGKVITDATLDTFGFGAPVAMRPMSYNGQETIRSIPLHNLSANKAVSMCIPGKSPEATTFLSMNSAKPDASNYPGDRVVGLGESLLKLTAADTNYLNACGVFNSAGNYYFKDSDPTLTNATNSTLIGDAGQQNIPSNALYLFNSLFSQKGLTFTTLTSNSTSRLTALAIQKNTCMKAAGASCYSDLDCAPSKSITDKIKLINYQDSTFNALLNPYEIRYWQENLVCSQATATTDSSFDPKNNKCCREIGNVISIGQNSKQLATDAVPKPATDKAPGIDVALSSSTRYSRVATYYSEMKNDNSSYPALKIPIADECSTGTCFDYSKLTNQAKTFALIGSKTSCSNSWIRSFSNGTHNWSSTHFQSFNTSAFKCYNFKPGSGSYSCTGAEDENDTACKFVQTSPTHVKAKGVLKFLGKLELLGIPQIAIPTESDYISTTDNDLSCRSNPSSQSTTYPDASGNYSAPLLWWYNLSSPLPSTPVASEILDSTTSKKYYSAADTTNFNSSFKQVFKSDEIVACSPAGTKMTSTSDLNKCCTGFINETTMKCALPDFVDLSVYTNKYVSSEGSSLSDTLFDEDGYIKDPTYVAQLACAKSMCASGKVTYGVLISNLKIPGLESSSNKYFRFLQGSAAADDADGMLTLYTKGLKINTHAYCLPATSGSSSNLSIISCQ